jgi:pyruvate, water dikinase
MQYIKRLDEVGISDIALVGGKNASLGEMIRALDSKGVRVPSGFAITAEGYRYFIEEGGLDSQIREILGDLNTRDLRGLASRGARVRNAVLGASLPAALEKEILEAYAIMEREYGSNVDVAVRSSATAEDLPDASFAGQQDTYLNVKGRTELLDKIRWCFASLFTNRAISYREDKGFDHFDVYLSVGVQKMVRSDLACSGVMFSIDTESGFKDAVYVTGAYGLGENVVQGIVNPDQFYVFKPTMHQGYRAIIERRLGTKAKKLIYRARGRGTRQVPVKREDRATFILSDEELLQLARWACIIEDHYGTPMDIEWAKDGLTQGLFILQARPETVHARDERAVLRSYVLEERGKLLITGESVGTKIGQGKVRLIANASEIHDFEEGEVLVTDMTDPDWEPIMKIAGAIVTNQGGRTCHAAIVSREIGVPCVIGTGTGTRALAKVDTVTVDCSEGQGKVYRGLLKYRVDEVEMKSVPRPRTNIMINVGIPDEAFIKGQIPNDGVGLAREEFIINSYIGIHPMALINYARLQERAKDEPHISRIVREIDKRTVGYDDKTRFYIDNLAMGIAKIGAGFYPNDVIVRFSDFKTNEYANLVGGRLYEPVESNPMIGWRGASRYYDERFKPAFGMECDAIKQVRNEMGLVNVKVMIPFCRTPQEGRKVIEVMREFGLVQGENGLEVYMMCEVPSNVTLADEFADVFDGFSIGSNDLTQLMLGIDRDSEALSKISDERDEAVMRVLKRTIDLAHAHKPPRKVGICGQAPSDFPEVAEYLVKCGIDSMSLNSDVVLQTRIRVAQLEMLGLIDS